MRSPAPEPREREGEVRPEYREMRPEYREVPRPVREVEFHPDLIRWSAILGGTFAALATMVVLGVLGALIGIGGVAGPAAVDPTTVGIYATISMIIALFFGGWLAARTSATVGGMSGIVDGSLVWATVLVIALFLTGFGVASILGGGLGQFNMLVSPAPGAPGGVDVTASALWSLIALVLSYAAAVLGGMFGANQEETTSPRA